MVRVVLKLDFGLLIKCVVVIRLFKVKFLRPENIKYDVSSKGVRMQDYFTHQVLIVSCACCLVWCIVNERKPSSM